MSGSDIRRLERLATDRLPSQDRRGPRIMTADELVVGRLNLLRCMAANPDRDQDCRVVAAAGVVEIEASIRQRAALHFGPACDARLAQLASEGRDISNYVPALTLEGEHDSLDIPRLMARRAALCARPDIVALAGMMCGKTPR